MSTKLPVLSIVIPVFNEIQTIERVLSSIQNSRYKRKEIFFVDGMSSDGTFEWLENAVKNIPDYYIEKNKNQYVSFGFNIVFPKTKGKYVSRVDGHSIYPSGYFEKAVEILERDEADVVGGPAKHVGKTWKGEAIARCMMHPFGVGRSFFRTKREKRYVDTIPFAIYKRSVFEDVGLYDEDLVRNQDDELNYRCREKGYRILMDPDLETEYSVRENLGDLWHQYFQYGLYKPMVFKKVPKGSRLYHFVPAIFTFSLPLLLGLGLWHQIFIIPLALYLILLIIISTSTKGSLLQKLYSLLVFPCLHIGYGLGFIIGLLKKY